MKNKKILIIGGTGALGKTLTRRYYKNNDILVLSRDEHKHVNLQKVWPTVKYRLGDVKDQTSIVNAIDYYKPEIIINTAAIKHVPICEVNPYESVQVNIIGHQNVLNAIGVARHQIDTLIFVSTDKACKPINVYGMSKAISEKLYQHFAKTHDDIKTVLVRYGNVLESTGSVIPLFKEILEEGNRLLPITDYDMTRFLLTLDQAAELIEWAYKHPESHGKIAIPKIKALKVLDIANALLKHYERGSTWEVGIRPGEKLHEEMISAEEWMRTEDYGENFMIGDEIIRTEQKSYNSHDSLMDWDQSYEFLKQSGVLR
jgi:UDP-glucose 4-epimerase